MGPAAPLFKPWAELSADERVTQERLMEVYAGMVENLDMNIGRVVSALKKSGAYDNTVILFFSDNGPSAAYMGLYQGNADGEYVRKNFDTSLANLGAPRSFAGLGPGWAYASSAPFKSFKMFVTEGGTLSPLIVKGPMVRKPGTMNDAFLGVEDVFPTVLDIAKAQRGKTANGQTLEPLKGLSFLPMLTGQSPSVRADDFERGEELFGNKAWRQGRWKISWLPKPYGEARWQLFDTQADRGETRDLAAEQPARLAAMAARYDRWARENSVVDWDYAYLGRELFDYFDWRKGIPVQIENRD